MDLQIAREYLLSEKYDKIITALNFMAKNGSINDLTHVMLLIKCENRTIQKSAVDTATSIIKENLIARFNQISPEMRNKLGAIMESLDPKIIEEISRDLFSKDEQRRLRAVQILGLLKKHPSTRLLMAKLVRDKDVKIRATAVSLLAKMIGPNDQEIVLSLLNDPDKRVRANTVEALESLGNKRMVPILLRLRFDQNNRTRANVLKALYNLGYTDIEHDILTMLDISDPLMKASALWVISQINIRSKKLEDETGQYLLYKNSMVVDNARKALVSFKTPRANGYLRYLDKITMI
ncbi:hypothetical protein CHISP_1886 [Chitinispirillum alkaliphilum]|nr:hypothetical protein CHISP_1886 [Chitinispirillum alkaliphilum]